MTSTAKGLFCLLALAILADDSAPSPAAIGAARALFERGWDSAHELVKTGEAERADELARAGHPDAERAARELGEATAIVIDCYGGDLRRLREEGGDRTGIERLLRQLPDMDDAAVAVFLRDAQMFWPEVAPFADDHARRAAERLGLPSDPHELMSDVARGRRHEQLAWLVGALALVDRDDEYGRITAAS